MLCNDDGAGLRISLQQFGDGGFERIQFARTLPPGGRACWRGQILGDGSTSKVEVTGNLADRPVLGEVEAMKGIDLLGG